MRILRISSLSFFLLILLASVAVQPALAQTAGKPVVKKHQKIPAGKDCSSCHKKTYAEWKASPHGTNDVQCTACHGEVTNTASLPSLSTCEQCHADQVAQVKTDPFMTNGKKTCATCHRSHTFKSHGKAA